MPSEPVPTQPVEQIPTLTSSRWRFRRWLAVFTRVMLTLLVRRKVSGKEHIPTQGPYIVAANHLWHLDPPLVMLELLPTFAEAMCAREIFDWRVVGWLVRSYGVIPVNRDGDDLAALKAAVTVLKRGHVLAIFPEGRESRTQQLEHGHAGIAYIAHLSDIRTVLPVAITGTQAAPTSWRRLRRPVITLTFGRPIELPRLSGDRQQAAEQALRLIMIEIARMLPENYQGVYADAI